MLMCSSFMYKGHPVSIVYENTRATIYVKGESPIAIENTNSICVYSALVHTFKESHAELHNLLS